MSDRYNGIDISHWNRIINYELIAKQIDFCIIKAGGSDKGFYTDHEFMHNYKALHDDYNVACGVYYFVGRLCIDEYAGRRDAEKLLNIIDGLKFEYPIYIDLESTSSKHRTGATAAVKAFCEEIESSGYYAGIYASDISGFKEKLILSELDRYDKWVARYGSEPKYVKDFGVWQQSSKGYIQGIAGYVDLDVSYKNYPAIMKRAHLNGY